MKIPLDLFIHANLSMPKIFRMLMEGEFDYLEICLRGEFLLKCFSC